MPFRSPTLSSLPTHSQTRSLSPLKTATMAQISEESMREAITERLGAVHVTVTDMSGMFLPLRRHPARTTPPKTPSTREDGGTRPNRAATNRKSNFRRLRSGLHLGHRLAPVPGSQLAQAPPPGQRGSQGRDRRHSRLDRKVPDPRRVRARQGEEVRADRHGHGMMLAPGKHDVATTEHIA